MFEIVTMGKFLLNGCYIFLKSLNVVNPKKAGGWIYAPSGFSKNAASEETLKPCFLGILILS